MNLSSLTFDDANYMLRTGRATIEDAKAFCETWNSVKTSTKAHCLEKIERIHGCDMRVPRIVVIDLPTTIQATSPYLNRPLRSYAQAIDEIATRRQEINKCPKTLKNTAEAALEMQPTEWKSSISISSERK